MMVDWEDVKEDYARKDKEKAELRAELKIALGRVKALEKSMDRLRKLTEKGLSNG